MRGSPSAAPPRRGRHALPQGSHRVAVPRRPRLSAALAAVRQRGGGGHRLVERADCARVPQSRPAGVCRAVHRHGRVRMAGVQHGSRPRRAGGDGAEQLGVPEGHGPPSHRRDAPPRAGSRDGVRRLRAILARLAGRAHGGVRPVRRRPAPAGGWQLADGPLLRFRGLDSGAAYSALNPPPWTGRPAGRLMSPMRTRLLPILLLPILLLALTTRTGAAQTALQLRWELVADTFVNDRGASRAAFTLTNRDTKALAPTGLAMYYSALHCAQPGTISAGVTIEYLPGDLHRLVPASGFAGLAPGASVRIPDVTRLLLNRSIVPQGPYIVFDDAKDLGVPLTDYVAVPFERPPQGEGRDPRLVSPANQFTLDSAIRDIPLSELPPVFPTPVEVSPGAGALHLAALPPVEASEALKSEAAFAAEYLRPYFGSTRTGGVPPLRLAVGAVDGQASAQAYALVVDPVQGVRIVGASPAGGFYGLQSLRRLLPP